MRASMIGLAVLLCNVASWGQTPDVADLVRITGGADGPGQNYTWQVVNLSDSRIVSIAFPHYHADVFRIPDGWEQETTGLATAGSKDSHLGGIARAFVNDPERGLAQGFDAQFELRIARVGAQRRPGEVTVKFANGTEVIVPDVELPTMKTFGEQYIMGFGLALIFGIMFLMTRKKKPAEPVEGEQA